MVAESSKPKLTGAQSSLSFLLGVIRFRKVPSKKKDAITQAGIRHAEEYSMKQRLARVWIVSAMRPSNRTWTPAAMRSFVGNRPGYFPPIAISPHGAPMANAS